LYRLNVSKFAVTEKMIQISLCQGKDEVEDVPVLVCFDHLDDVGIFVGLGKVQVGSLQVES
jgi:hypothetical protein